MKRLYRSRTDRWIAGVCGGVGAYFEVDSNPVRLAFVLLALWNGFGVLLYLLMMIIVPEEPLQVPVTEPGLPPPSPEEDEDGHQRRARLLGVIAVLGGVYLLLRNTELFTSLLQDRALAVVLIIGGLLILLLRPNRL